MAKRNHAEQSSFAARVWDKLKDKFVEWLVVFVVGVASTFGAFVTGLFTPSRGAIQFNPPQQVAANEPIDLGDAIISPAPHIKSAAIVLTPDEHLYLKPDQRRIDLGSVTSESKLMALHNNLPRIFGRQKGVGQITIDLLSGEKKILNPPLRRLFEIRRRSLGKWKINIDGVPGEMELRDTDQDAVFGIYTLQDGTTGSLLGRIDGAETFFDATGMRGESSIRWHMRGDVKESGAELSMDGKVEYQQPSTDPNDPGWKTIRERPLHADKTLTNT